MESDADVVAIPGEGLVDAVVYDLVDKVVKTVDAGRADVHRGALANRFEPLEDLDILFGVISCGLLLGRRLGGLLRRRLGVRHIRRPVA